jgi:hypothetical protein
MIQSAIPPIEVTTEVTTELIEAVGAFGPTREVEHCGAAFSVSAFDIYATCPRCSASTMGK